LKPRPAAIQFVVKCINLAPPTKRGGGNISDGK